MNSKHPLAITLLIGHLILGCSSSTEKPASSEVAESAKAETPESPIVQATPSPTPSTGVTEFINATAGDTGEDSVPDLSQFTFRPYPLQGIRPRIVQIQVTTTKDSSYRASNRATIENAVRVALERALKTSNITVVSRATNKIDFEIKDCRNVANPSECIHIDAVFRSPRFELEVGGYSQLGSDSPAGDLSKAYAGAINAVIERLDKQLVLVQQYQ